MKKVASAVSAAVVSAGLLMAGSGAANADPYGCIAYQYSRNQTAAECNSGTGTYRARAKCYNIYPAGSDYFTYGATVRIGQRSIATCGPLDTAGWPSVQIMSI